MSETWSDLYVRMPSAPETGSVKLSDPDQSAGMFDIPDYPFPLEIAAGERPTPDFIHNDFRALPDIELVCDAREELLEIVGSERVSHLRACHVLEHFPYGETVNVLLLWKNLLVPGGSIHIEVPNLAWQVRACAAGEINSEEFVYFAYGEQNYEGNFHYAAFDEPLLRKRLEEAGFTNVGIVDIGQVLIANAFKSL